MSPHFALNRTPNQPRGADAIQEYLAARDDLLEGAMVREVEVAS